VQFFSSFQLPEGKLPCFKMSANDLKLAIEEYKGKRVELSSKKEFEKEKNEE
jgi:NifU-like protein involved in Fe-S cluster formation